MGVTARVSVLLCQYESLRGTGGRILQLARHRGEKQIRCRHKELGFASAGDGQRQ